VRSPETSPTATAAAAAPGSCRAVFVAFTRLALQGFGGVLPVAQRELVERLRWLSREQFLEMLSVAQVLPGPNVVNLALMVGDRFLGWRGALAALAGMLMAPLLVVLLLAALAAHTREWPAVQGALRGMGVVAAGLVLATALKLARPLQRSVLGRPAAGALALAALLAVGVWRWPLVAVVLALAAIACGWAWWRLGRAGAGAST
jgi:chromate transporter